MGLDELVYLPTCIIDFYGKFLGKCPMDMGYEKSRTHLDPMKMGPYM